MDTLGIRGKAKDLMKSYLDGHKCFWEVQTFMSETKEMDKCSVIQGSKLLGVFYTIATAEVPLLMKIMQNQEGYEIITGKKLQRYQGIKHEIVLYVDDSTNIISHNNMKVLKEYLQDYLFLLEKFYAKNNIKMNSSKTMFMFMNKSQKEKKEITMKLITEEGE